MLLVVVEASFATVTPVPRPVLYAADQPAAGTPTTSERPAGQTPAGPPGTLSANSGVPVSNIAGPQVLRSPAPSTQVWTARGFQDGGVAKAAFGRALTRLARAA